MDRSLEQLAKQKLFDEINIDIDGIEYRDYQPLLIKEAILDIDAEMVFGMKHEGDIVLNAPMGSGKTIKAISLAIYYSKQGYNVLIIMNNLSLLEQLEKWFGNLMIPIGIVDAKRKEYNVSRITIAMEQSLVGVLNKIHNRYDIIIKDEWDRGLQGERYASIKKSQPNSIFIGMTATPYNNKGLLYKEMDSMVGHGIVSHRSLRDSGYLTPMKYISTWIGEQFQKRIKKIGSTSSEYTQEQLSFFGENNVLEDCNELLLTLHEHEKINIDKKTIVFTTSIDKLEAIVSHLESIGVRAMPYHSELSKEQEKAIIDEFRNKEGGTLVTVAKASIGFDVPAIEQVYLYTATKMMTFLMQELGRGIRIDDGKEISTVVDFGNILHQHPDIYSDFEPLPYGDYEPFEVKANKDKYRAKYLMSLWKDAWVKDDDDFPLYLEWTYDGYTQYIKEFDAFAIKPDGNTKYNKNTINELINKGFALEELEYLLDTIYVSKEDDMIYFLTIASLILYHKHCTVKDDGSYYYLYYKYYKDRGEGEYIPFNNHLSKIWWVYNKWTKKYMELQNAYDINFNIDRFNIVLKKEIKQKISSKSNFYSWAYMLENIYQYM